MSEEISNKRWYHYFFNKYLIVGISFIVWMIFFDQNSYLMHKELNKDITTLKEEKAYFDSEIAREQEQLDKINEDPEEFERLAREKYLMKKENEDIFVIEKKDSLNYE